MYYFLLLQYISFILHTPLTFSKKFIGKGLNKLFGLYTQSNCMLAN